MGKKIKRLDFVLFEDDYEKIVFRFYPRKSNCHSFGDEPPKSWKEVYKVYYHYQIIKFYKDDDERVILFTSGVDECSIIDEIANRMKLISAGTTVYKGTNRDGEAFSIKLLGEEVLPFGDGVSWTIDKRYRRKEYIITVFNSNNVGYRFVMNNQQMTEFGNYLTKCCEYMLAHGDPI